MNKLLFVAPLLTLGVFVACSSDPDPITPIVDAGTDAPGAIDTGTPSVDAGRDAAGPTHVTYKITSVTGTYTGDGVNVVDATRTDTLAVNTCTYAGQGDGKGLVVGVDGTTPTIQVSGTTTCPAGSATSTTAAACTAAATTANATLFQGSVEIAGWADDSVVTFKILAPPSGMPACNNAGLVIAAAQPWGIQGTTTAAKFKSLQPFEVHFKGPDGGGTKTLVSGTNTSKVSWDFTMTITPQPL